MKEKGLLKSILRPGSSLLVLAGFSIGAGVAHYLGKSILWWQSLCACLFLLFVFWGSNLLDCYFDHPECAFSILKKGHKRFQYLLGTQRSLFLMYALFSFTTAAVLVTLLLVNRQADLTLLLPVFSIAILFLFDSTPPLFFRRKGYGELAEGVAITVLIPLLALIVNNGEPHPILGMLTLPIFLILLAVGIAFSLRTYVEDRDGGSPNLLNRLDWSKAMKLHNFLIPLAYLLIALFGLVGLPWGFTWPQLLTIPIAIFEEIQMMNILNGGKPNWTVLELTAGSLIGVLGYLIVITLWIH